MRGSARVVEARTEIAPPLEAIVRLTRQERIDLVTMATHGRGGLARFVLGSVATGTLQRAGVPILLARPDALAHPAEATDAAPVAAPRRVPRTTALSLTASELGLLERGLGRLAADPEDASGLTTAARDLLKKVHEAEQALRSRGD